MIPPAITSRVMTGPALMHRAKIDLAEVRIEGASLAGDLVLPMNATGVVIVLIGTGCIGETPRNPMLAGWLSARGLGTLRIPLLTEWEAEKDAHTGVFSFDLDLLNQRLAVATEWLMNQPEARGLGIGYFATGTSAAAALMTAERFPGTVQAMVLRSGRPDFAGEALRRTALPTLLIVGERDEGIMELNRHAFERMAGEKEFAVIKGAGHLFEESDALERVAALAADWFCARLHPCPRPGVTTVGKEGGPATG